MESTLIGKLDLLAQENNSAITNSNPIIVPAGESFTQDSCGILFPTTLAQESLEISAHRKLSLLDRLLGKLKDGREMKEHFVKLLLANANGSYSADMMIHDSRRDNASTLIKILDSAATKPDAETVKRLIGFHPVH
jgi:hypothetical protein